jgi:trehalose synthase
VEGATIEQVEVSKLPYERFEDVLGDELYDDLLDAVSRAEQLLDGRRVWCVNSTARGGGVAEMLDSLLAYTRGAGIDTRWAVIEGDEEFFAVTKRLHNRLHGAAGDGAPLDDAARRAYEATLKRNTGPLVDLIGAGDVVLLHDPQTAGLAAPLRDAGARVVWRSHVGADHPDGDVREAWDFLAPYVRDAERWVFSRREFAWEGLDEDRICVIPPSIDAFSAKNQDLEPGAVIAILAAAGLLADGHGDAAFARRDGSQARVEHVAEMTEEAPLPPDVPVVVQVSRWDRLKDPRGVLTGFVSGVPRDTGAHLVIAGPQTTAVSDDPEGAEVLDKVQTAWRELDEPDRARVHLAGLPMADIEENAAMVNALQRHAAVVVQKSLAEGFGLTIAEAMWKRRPVVAGRVGGIQDQVIHEETGLLIDDPTDLEAFGAAVSRLLSDTPYAERMGDAARVRVREHFLGARHLQQWLAVFEDLLAES